MAQAFQPDNNGDMFEKKSPVIKSKVIKNDEVNLKPEKMIITQNHHSDTKQTKVSPIKNNDEIIGVMTECSCGEVIKIYFNSCKKYWFKKK